MPGRELLERFRPAAAPGAVTRVGVPSDAGQDAGLLAVLAALRSTQDTAAGIRAQARAAAEEQVEAAEEQAKAILARARLSAAERRATAAAAARATGEREGRRLVEAASLHADRIRADGRRRGPVVVAQVLADVRATDGGRR
jgi:vacuolar-type H+-ATPase subunit H